MKNVCVLGILALTTACNGEDGSITWSTGDSDTTASSSDDDSSYSAPQGKPSTAPKGKCKKSPLVGKWRNYSEYDTPVTLEFTAKCEMKIAYCGGNYTYTKTADDIGVLEFDVIVTPYNEQCFQVGHHYIDYGIDNNVLYLTTEIGRSAQTWYQIESN